MASRHAYSWSDLPSDLLGLVLRRLHSLTDRVRVGAVCQSWCSGARQHPKLPPPMPWVALGDKAYLDIVNNSVHMLNLTLPRDADCGGSIDHLLFLKRDGGGCFLVDPFSEAEHPIPYLAFYLKERAREEMFSLSYRPSLSIKKVVAHWPQGSSAEPIVAALITNSQKWYKSTIFVCRAGRTGVGKDPAMFVKLRRVLDIAFFSGKLYALYTDGELGAIEIDEGSGGNPVICNVKYAIERIKSSNDDFDDSDDEQMVDFAVNEDILPDETYLVQSGDQLLKLYRRVIDYSTMDTKSFDVCEADFDASPCRWKQVRSLHGRALFLGRYCSSSMSVPVSDGHYGAQEDCIYFVRHAGDSGIYNVRSDNVVMRPLMPVLDKEVLEQSWRPWIPTWIFPDQSIIQTHYMKRSTTLQPL